ncbi:MAG: ATP-dependent DNA helicase, partial [Pseudomonadota bacterium]
RDGDMAGGDLPGWLPELIGRGRSVLLADRRGECIYSACEHYHRCFIEKSVRRARRADIVVANHALVMVQAALGGLDDNTIPTRYVFDEGHHLFDAADSAFSGHLTGQETADFRRWLMGAEGRRTSRARGLRRRLEDVVAGDDASMSLLDEALRAGRFLPNEGWPNRVMDGKPNGPTEAFLALARNQVLARTRDPESPYGLEVEAGEPIEGLVDAARILTDSLEGISRPLGLLADRLETRLDAEAETLETTMRLRMEALTRTIRRRANVQVNGWRQMLKSLGAPAVPGNVDWLAIDRMDGRDIDVGLHRHWIDPAIPFIDFVARPAHGLLVTSATLSDGSGEDESDWEVALDRTGARHLDHPAVLTRSRSPFDYPNATKVLIVNDVRKDQMDQVAAAYRELFLAARGGALGLFTAISRLRAVHRRLAEPLESAVVPLYGQHVDAMDLPTLIEIFRAEEDSCLLGTDAARDGMDVPGNALRLIVFDRVPWPRPDILHRARRTAFGGRHYDDQITRLRLKQAFGRLVRKSDDRGVFVLLDPMMPTRLTTAFPEGVSVERVGLAEAVVATRSFLTHSD